MRRADGRRADQLIVMEPAQNDAATAFMRIYNMDGREAEACGNATRCVAWLLLVERSADNVTVETLAGLLHCERAGELRRALRDGTGNHDCGDVFRCLTTRIRSRCR
ncbi:MAG: hypothetical protein U5K76_10610 [Woeseiaceae bacterium]|nr:hypothetical protein [Woeseiaceae bacterium]